MMLQYLFNVCVGEVYFESNANNHSSLPKTTTPKFASNGTRTIWPSGTTGRPGTAQHTTTLKPGLGIVSAVWEKRLSSIHSPSLGERR